MTRDGCDGALTVSEFCKHYRIGRTKAYDEIKSGRLAARKVGTKTLILAAEAERWATELPRLEPSRL